VCVREAVWGAVFHERRSLGQYPFDKAISYDSGEDKCGRYKRGRSVFRKTTKNELFRKLARRGPHGESSILTLRLGVLVNNSG